jgi:hypothetical protein
MDLGDNRMISSQSNLWKATRPEEGFYTPGPNPNLRSFVEKHRKPYDPENDKYSKEPRVLQKVLSRGDAIFNMHTYHKGKKHYQAIMAYLDWFTEKGDLVLDLFCGSGMTGVAAIALQREPILIDLSPSATFITKHYCAPPDPEKGQQAVDLLMKKVRQELEDLYETRCDRCSGRAITDSVVWSQQFQCERCLKVFPLFENEYCPNCLREGEKMPLETSGKRYGAVPVMVNYTCLNGCSPSGGSRQYNDKENRKREFFEKYDYEKIKQIESKNIPYFYPKVLMPKGSETMRLYNAEIPYLADLFTKRNLYAQACLLENIKKLQGIDEEQRDALLLSFQGNILLGTIMQRFREAGGGHQGGTYYCPPIFLERSQIGTFERKWGQIRSGYENLSHLYLESQKSNLIVSTQSATNLTQIPSNSIDYIFTDPPYGGKVQYGELNFLWEAWMGFDTSWLRDEITVDEIRGMSERDWAGAMSKAFREAFRVLKPGRWLSLCYHDAAEGTWHLVQDIMLDAGFIPDNPENLSFIEYDQKGILAMKAKAEHKDIKILKRDLVRNYRKPRPEELPGTVVFSGREDKKTIISKAREIIMRFLEENPGSTRDRVSDYTINFLVGKGQMEPHDLNQILSEVGESREDGRWFLKKEFEEIGPSETEKEEKAAERIEKFMLKTMKEKYLEAVPQSDILEFYFSVPNKPRRRLWDFVDDFFWKTLEGYRPSKDETEKQAKKLDRISGISRKLKRFAHQLTEGVSLPSEVIPDTPTLAGWIKHCRRSGFYQEGVILFERGGIRFDKLAPKQKIELEEDYRVCKKKAGMD